VVVLVTRKHQEVVSLVVGLVEVAIGIEGGLVGGVWCLFWVGGLCDVEVSACRVFGGGM